MRNGDIAAKQRDYLRDTAPALPVLMLQPVAAPTDSCEETPEDRLGPYYTPGAPTRTTLVEPGMVGTRLVITGRVRSTRGLALGLATIDVWQTNDAGEYDHVGFTLRGKFVADAEGRYVIETILPGRYLDGEDYRPRHIHVIASADGHVAVTTQLYFDGDPFNAADIGFKESLMLTPRCDGDGLAATFDFVLA
jgi:protocatechuate 3,4-dioxygenase beta subunit